MKFKHVAGLVSSIAILAAISTGAIAQTANSNSNSTSGAAANSGSSSGAAAISRGGAADARNSSTQNTSQGVNTGATVNQTYNNAGQSGLSYSGGTNNYSTERQTGDVTIRTTPTVYAPPVSGGNPCTLAVSGGVSVIGWGAAAGGTFVDEDCATRQKIAMIHNAGYAGAAKELMCNDKATYYAFRSSGQPCQPRAAFDGVVAPVPQQPMVQQQPTPIVAPAPVPVRSAGPPPRCNPARGIVDNCYSGELDRTVHTPPQNPCDHPHPPVLSLSPPETASWTGGFFFGEPHEIVTRRSNPRASELGRTCAEPRRAQPGPVLACPQRRQQHDAVRERLLADDHPRG